jgi:cytidine deaminase
MMNKHEVTFEYIVYAGINELPEADRNLCRLAQDACRKAYAPYSEFRVGAAIRTTDGMIVTGSNQENSSFPVGQCAERVTLYLMTHQIGRATIDTMAIVVDHPSQTTPATPCGSCRQLLSHFP